MEYHNPSFSDDVKKSRSILKNRSVSKGLKDSLAFSLFRVIIGNYGRLLWKYNTLKIYKQEGYFRITPKFLLKEIMVKNFRMENYRLFLLKKRAFLFDKTKHEFGINFNENTSFIALNEVFHERIYDSIPEFVPCKEDTIVDIGAQGGDYTLLCAVYYGVKQVHSFEPLSANFELLKRNIDQNNAGQVEAHQCAIGSSDRIENIYWAGNMMCKSEKVNFENVSIRRLDSFHTEPTILKIDVEGFELDVLDGAKETINRCRPKIILEVHSKELKLRCISILNSFGYSLVKSGRKVSDILSETNLIQNLYFLPN